MDYTPNIDAQGMRRPMGPVDQPNWNGGPKLIHNPQVMNTQTVGQPNLANAIRHLQFQIHMQTTGLDATADRLITVAAN